MVETISPVVHGGRRKRYWASVAAHVAGAALAAAAFGALLGSLGSVLTPALGRWGLIALVALALAYMAKEALGFPVPVPALRRQVPEWWRSFFSPVLAAFLYGLGLGIGFLTFLGHGTYVVVTVGALLSGDPAVGALVAAPFGLARGLSVALAHSPRAADPALVVDRLEHLAGGRVPSAVNLAALSCLSIISLAAPRAT